MIMKVTAQVVSCDAIRKLAFRAIVRLVVFKTGAPHADEPPRDLDTLDRVYERPKQPRHQGLLGKALLVFGGG